MIQGLVHLKDGETLLAVGLTGENFNRFTRGAPDPAKVEVVVLCVSSNEAGLEDVLRSHNLIAKDAKLEIVPRAAAPVSSPVPTSAAVKPVVKGKVTRRKPAPTKKRKR